MPEISHIELYELPAQPVLSIRTVISFCEFPSKAEKAFSTILAYLDEIQRLPAAGPFVCYHNTDLDHLDVEMGFPVAGMISDKGDIRYCVHPAGRCAAGLFQGSYEQSDPLMMRMMEWITARGMQPNGRIYNEYLNDTHRLPKDWLMRIRIPIKPMVDQM
jgi:effector-binding domain-containing protein